VEIRSIEEIKDDLPRELVRNFCVDPCGGNTYKDFNETESLITGDPTMEIGQVLIADLKDLMWEIKRAESRVAENKFQIDRFINSNHVAIQEQSEPKAKTIERMFDQLIDAKNDMDSAQDYLKDILVRLDEIVEAVEYEAIRQKATRV
jgi:hypothetical protein